MWISMLIRLLKLDYMNSVMSSLALHDYRDAFSIHVILPVLYMEPDVHHHCPCTKRFEPIGRRSADGVATHFLFQATLAIKNYI